MSPDKQTSHVSKRFAMVNTHKNNMSNFLNVNSYPSTIRVAYHHDHDDGGNATTAAKIDMAPSTIRVAVADNHKMTNANSSIIELEPRTIRVASSAA